ncbi:hypothetical protein [endosymbiont GvMRE of Glomus versiforme]|uniref:hypothetical protein n=1 Tax=endosymbiont GvMRE of Glomus versiforme TaxID=2039283 RepID=UPI000EDD52F6|nr:hypothetical protein [endosymbiont GvMRE of Glomus versiforme]RHZ35279.1 hypothetical protein GvMRE_IIg134 [endosymbiont GvMRE of Glomus versiforme]
MVNAQVWLNNNILDTSLGNSIQELHIRSDKELDDPYHISENEDETNKFYLPLEISLTGDLDLSAFTDLEHLTIEKQFIRYLTLTNISEKVL